MKLFLFPILGRIEILPEHDFESQKDLDEMQWISKKVRVAIKERWESMPFAEHKSTDILARIHCLRFPIF